MLRPLEIETKTDAEKNNYSEGMQWRLRTLMAQLGDEESVQDCVKAIRLEPEGWKRGPRLRRLGRVRHPLIVVLLQEQLNDSTVYRDDQNFVFHIDRIAAQVLSQMLVGFPAPEAKRGHYDSKDIVRCREWMNKQTNWQFRAF